METEKKYFGGWWIWVLALIIVSVIMLSALSYMGIIGRTVVEREVFKRSFQYTEARRSEIATYEAQLSEIDRLLANASLDNGTRSNLEAQAASIRILLSVARSK